MKNSTKFGIPQKIRSKSARTVNTGMLALTAVAVLLPKALKPKAGLNVQLAAHITPIPEYGLIEAEIV